MKQRGRLILLAVCLAAMLSPRMVAQEAAAAESDSNAAVAHESKEAAGEDQAAAFRKSPSVKLVARVTGLSLENAYWLSMGINFAIIAGAVFWISRKTLPGVFRHRTASIQKAMAEARIASEDARKRLLDVEMHLSRLDADVAAMREAADRDTAEEEARIKTATEEEVRRVVDAAEQEIVAAAKAARRNLTNYAADLAVALAQKQIHVTEPQDEALLRGFAQNLGSTRGSGND